MNSQDAKSLRPEQKFFDDPAVDRLMGTVMALATEVFVLKSRLSSLEQLVQASDIGDLPGTPVDEAAQAAEAKAYSDHLFRPLLGLQDALGPTD